MEGGMNMRTLAQKMKRATLIALVVMMLSGTALADFNATVLSKKMKVYFAPSTASEQIGTLKRWTTVTVEAHQGGWARINYKGRIGFAKVADMYSNIVYKYGKLNKDAKIYYITPDNLNPRWGALGKGVKVYIRGCKGDQWLVSNKEMDVLGYVPMSSVTIY